MKRMFNITKTNLTIGTRKENSRLFCAHVHKIFSKHLKKSR